MRLRELFFSALLFAFHFSLSLGFLFSSSAKLGITSSSLIGDTITNYTTSKHSPFMLPSNQRKRSASPSGDQDSNKRRRTNGAGRVNLGDGTREVIDVDNQLDEKEEKKEREVKEDITAATFQINHPDLVVSPLVDKDLICCICFGLMTEPTGTSNVSVSFRSQIYVVCLACSSCRV
jgi:hypothetical protein